MNKKALSVIVGYVLLISITLALSVMVYGWLKFYVSDSEIEACPNNVNIIINGYECYNRVLNIGDEPSTPANLTVILKNKGLFKVDGYILRVHDTDGAEFGIYTINDTGEELVPGEESVSTYVFNDSNPSRDWAGELGTVTIVEVQPFILDEDGKISCQSYISQSTVCK